MDRDNIKIKIEQAALKLFKKISYSKTSVNDIAKAVGINKAIIYQYFKSKEDIIASILLARFHGEIIDETDFYFDKKISIDEKINKYIIRIIDEFIEIKDLLFGTFDNLDGVVVRDVLTQFTRYKSMIVDFIMEIIKDSVNSKKDKEIIKNDIEEFFYLIASRIIFYFFQFDWDKGDKVKKLILSYSMKLFNAMVLA